MYDDEEIPEARIGLDSPAWMTRAIAYLASKSMLYRGVDGMISYLSATEDPNAFEALDHLVQCTINGVWQDPYADDQEESAPPITEDDIQEFLDGLGGNQDG